MIKKKHNFNRNLIHYRGDPNDSFPNHTHFNELRANTRRGKEEKNID
jgi:transposase-like protein